MDLFTAYRLIHKIDKDIGTKDTKSKEKQIIQRKSCSNCGQNTYWCQCSNNNLRNSLVNDSEDLPIIIVLPETQYITLLEMQGAISESDQSMNVDMGGSSLVHATTAEPLQRLMIGYDEQSPEVLARLLNVLLNERWLNPKE